MNNTPEILSHSLENYKSSPREPITIQPWQSTWDVASALWIRQSVLNNLIPSWQVRTKDVFSLSFQNNGGAVLAQMRNQKPIRTIPLQKEQVFQDREFIQGVESIALYRLSNGKYKIVWKNGEELSKMQYHVSTNNLDAFKKEFKKVVEEIRAIPDRYQLLRDIQKNPQFWNSLEIPNGLFTSKSIIIEPLTKMVVEKPNVGEFWKFLMQVIQESKSST